MTKRLELIEYFDSLSNEIDLKAENLLAELSKSNITEYETLIDNRRQLFIDEIERVKNHNLNNWPSDDEAKSASHFFKLFCLLVDRNNANDENDSTLKKINQTFGYLIVLDGYLSPREVSFLKEMLYFRHIDHEPDDLDDNDNASVDDIQLDIQEFEQSCNKKIKIFESDQLLSIYNSISISLNAFHKQADFIVRTNKRKLFKVDHLDFSNVGVKSINQVALNMFFTGNLSVNITRVIYLQQTCDLLVEFLHWLQKNLKIKSFSITIYDNINMDWSCFSHVQNLHQVNVFPVYTDSYRVNNLPDLTKLNVSSKRSSIKSKSMDQISFENLPSLTEFELSFTDIDLVDSDSLNRFEHLIRLKLTNNKIKSTDVFGHLVNLKHLDLSSNQISELNTLATLTNLKELKLNQNQLEHIGEFAFQRLSQLELLDLSNNKIGRIESRAFYDLKNLITFNLDSNELDTLDNGLFLTLVSLKYLNLSGNRLTSISSPDVLEGLTNLQSLDLSSMKIMQITAYSFKHLVNLKILNLNSNQLDTLYDYTFIGLIYCQELSLFANRLANIMPKAFYGLYDLIQLNLRSNEIYYLGKKTFKSLKKLRDLNVSNNRLNSIEVNTFENQPELIRLDLNQNSINSLQANSFNGLTNLLELSLANNKLAQIKPNTFASLVNLQKLCLNFNELESLAKETFTSLTKLSNLQLNYNRIERLDVDAFEPVRNVTVLCLSSNRIEKVENLTFSRLSALKKLSLARNQIESMEENCFSTLMNLKYLDLRFNKIKENDFRSSIKNLVNLKIIGFDEYLIENRDAYAEILNNLKNLSLFL